MQMHELVCYAGEAQAAYDDMLCCSDENKNMRFQEYKGCRYIGKETIEAEPFVQEGKMLFQQNIFIELCGVKVTLMTQAHLQAIEYAFSRTRRSEEWNSMYMVKHTLVMP